MFDITELLSAPSDDILAKGGRGGGGGSSGSSSIRDSWDAPPLVKAIFAFQVIWFILLLSESLMILTRLKLISKSARSSKAPYVLAALVALVTSLFYLFAGIRLRTSYSSLPGTSNLRTSLNLSAVAGFLYDVILSFLPLIFLWIGHLRGLISSSVVTGSASRNNSFVSSTWKKILDWSFVIIVLALSVAYSALATHVNNMNFNRELTATQQLNYRATLTGLNRAVEAFFILFLINVVVSLICLKVAQKSAKIADKVVTLLLSVSVPFLILYALEMLVAEIYSSTQLFYDAASFALALVIIEGTVHFMAFMGLILTMKYASAPASAHFSDYSAVSNASNAKGAEAYGGSVGYGGGYPVNQQQQQPGYPIVVVATPYQTPPPPPMVPPQQQGAWGAPPTGPPPMAQYPQGYPYQVPYGHPNTQSWQR
ncbi:hypothetical protein FRC17_009567 [Serendipita sp. 399]|nr:hypothetical protein FRC17_009567 [Serendipita sp. 399]